MSAGRGKRLQRAFADYLTAWWPHAESNPNGRRGRDILGTPGVAWEIKTAAEFKPTMFVAQAQANAGGDVPVVVYFPNGYGARSCGQMLAILPVHDLMNLLVGARYTTPPRPGPAAPLPGQQQLPL